MIKQTLLPTQNKQIIKSIYKSYNLSNKNVKKIFKKMKQRKIKIKIKTNFNKCQIQNQNLKIKIDS